MTEESKKTLAEHVNSEEFIKFMDEKLKTPEDVRALLERHEKQYDESWARYQESVAPKKEV